MILVKVFERPCGHNLGDVIVIYQAKIALF